MFSFRFRSVNFSQISQFSSKEKVYSKKKSFYFKSVSDFSFSSKNKVYFKNKRKYSLPTIVKFFFALDTKPFFDFCYYPKIFDFCSNFSYCCLKNSAFAHIFPCRWQKGYNFSKFLKLGEELLLPGRYSYASIYDNNCFSERTAIMSECGSVE